MSALIGCPRRLDASRIDVINSREEDVFRGAEDGLTGIAHDHATFVSLHGKSGCKISLVATTQLDSTSRHRHANGSERRRSLQPEAVKKEKEGEVRTTKAAAHAVQRVKKPGSFSDFSRACDVLAMRRTQNSQPNSAVGRQLQMLSRVKSPEPSLVMSRLVDFLHVSYCRSSL